MTKTKKHQTNLIISLPTFRGANRVPLTKLFVDGKEQKAKYKFPTYWDSKIIQWNTLEDLFFQIKPIIEGGTKENFYTAMMYGEFDQEQKHPQGFLRRKREGKVVDVARSYFILDIETDSFDYDDINDDLHKIRKWLVEEYDWIKDDTGMILHFSPSACLVDSNGRRTPKGKQIRVRAILETSEALKEEQREDLLHPFVKHTGEGADFDNHIDNATHQFDRIMFMAPPILENTTRKIQSDICILHRGNPVDTSLLRWHSSKVGGDADTSNSVPSSFFNYDGRVISKSKYIKTTPTEEIYEKIGDKNRWRGIYEMLWSAYIDKNVAFWRNKLLSDKAKLGTDRDAKDIDGVIEYIEREHSRSFNIPDNKKENHTQIDIEEYLLKDWEELHDKTIVWKDKGVILQKLYEGAGKTVGLAKLRELYPEMSFLYMAPRTQPVINACSDFNLTNYQQAKEEGTLADLDSNGNPIHKFVGICYPSLTRFIDGLLEFKEVVWDIVVLDEIEELLVFALDENKILFNRQDATPSLVNQILKHIIQNAKLVVGLDARLSNLTLNCLESWRKDEDFTIYTQQTVKPFKDHRFTFVNDLHYSVHQIIDAVKQGKKVAVVSELDCKRKQRLPYGNLNTLRKYVEQETDSKGISIDKDNKDLGRNNAIMSDVPKGLETLLDEGAIQHIWFSPVNMSTWSYVSDIAQFDLVVGLYPQNILTAPNIIQHLKRFRQTKDFLLFVKQKDYAKPKQIWEEMFPLSEVKEGNVRFEQDEFDERYSIYNHFKIIQLNNREDHLIEMIEDRGGLVIDKRNIKAMKTLNKFIKENKDAVISLMKSKSLWKEYAKLKEGKKKKSSNTEPKEKDYIEIDLGNNTKIRRYDVK